MSNHPQVATFANGCFWCTEAVFQDLKGVEKVESGYTDGHVENPTYEQVCSGKTGHAEALQISFDPALVSYEDLLEVFWKTHDPTTLNRQGADTGTQYRSAIYYHDAHQQELAEASMHYLESVHAYASPIVTEIKPAGVFYRAENYHMNYFNQNGSNPYCAMVVKPKVEKFKKAFAAKLK